MKRFVHDTGSLLAGMPALLPGENYTTPLNVDEVRDLESKRSLSIYSSKLKIVMPSKENVEVVKRTSLELGEELSETDVAVVALALQLRGVLLSDDYGVLNVAKVLGLEVKSVRTKGIEGTMRWVKYCPFCKKEYPPTYKTCPSCGSALKRRPAYNIRKGRRGER